ncbi:MAG: nitronate monooxygenase, partial [Dehalococcoidia bacterium]|nr:nitronate monooxygenase [Dehalococcoidia bacterium]
MLTTALTRHFALDHPIIQAGMSSDCGATLAAAVSNAGGLGTVGSLGRTPEDLEQELAAMRGATSRPWSVNLATFDWSPFAETLVDVAISARPPVVTLSFGNTL